MATGGLAALIGKGSKYIKHVDDLLDPGRPAPHLGTEYRGEAGRDGASAKDSPPLAVSGRKPRSR